MEVRRAEEVLGLASPWHRWTHASRAHTAAWSWIALGTILTLVPGCISETASRPAEWQSRTGTPFFAPGTNTARFRAEGAYISKRGEEPCHASDLVWRWLPQTSREAAVATTTLSLTADGSSARLALLSGATSLVWELEPPLERDSDGGGLELTRIDFLLIRVSRDVLHFTRSQGGDLIVEVTRTECGLAHTLMPIPVHVEQQFWYRFAVVD